jgi:hypothetical protein
MNCQLLVITVLLMLNIGVTILAEKNIVDTINDLSSSKPVLSYCD